MPLGGHAVVMLVFREGRVLAARRAIHVVDGGYWTFPTGTVELDETQAQTVEREAHEELGLAVQAVEKVWECPTDDGCHLLHWWTTRWVSGQMRLSPDEISDVRWVDGQAFLELSPTFAGDRRFAHEILPELLA